MLILSIDSAVSSCSACVWQDGKILSMAEESMERGQDQRLMPLILDVMKEANTDFNALNRVAVTRGPGSFTGIRIALAAARGIGLASGKPVFGIDRFRIFRTRNPAKNLLVIMESKRKELFVQFFPAQGEASEPGMMNPDEVIAFLKTKSDITVTGDVRIEGLSIQPAAEKEIITAASLAAKATEGAAETLPRPLYIRPPDVTFAKTAAR